MTLALLSCDKAPDSKWHLRPLTHVQWPPLPRPFWWDDADDWPDRAGLPPLHMTVPLGDAAHALSKVASDDTYPVVGPYFWADCRALLDVKKVGPLPRAEGLRDRVRPDRPKLLHGQRVESRPVVAAHRDRADTDWARRDTHELLGKWR